MRFDVEEIKHRRPLHDVAYGMGFKVERRSNRHFVLCPFHEERNASCQLIDFGFHCHGCDEKGDIFKFVMRVRRCNFPEALEYLNDGIPISQTAGAGINNDADKTAFALKLWNDAKPIHQSPCIRYFQSRAILEETVTTARSIRFHPELPHPETKSKHPAILFLCEKFSSDDGEVENPEPDAITGIHRIYLSDDCAGKLQTGSAKMLLGSPTGAGIWFDYPSQIIYLAEGPENALIVRQAFGFNTISGISAAHMQNLIIPKFVRELHVFGDFDEAGRKAVIKLSQRIKSQVCIYVRKAA